MRILSKKKLLGDLILALLLIALGISLIFVTRACRGAGAYAVVSVNGEMVDEISLLSDGEYPINGGTNILVIENGKAYMKYASCPDGLCVGQGKISLTGERITCLPNRVMVEIVGDGEEIFESK